MNSLSRVSAFAIIGFLAAAGCGARVARQDAIFHASPGNLANDERALRSVLQALGNEHPDEYDQFETPERRPLQRFPRLTFPALAEPQESADLPPSWYVPLIFDRSQIGEDVDSRSAFQDRYAIYLRNRGTTKNGAPWNVTAYLGERTVLTTGAEEEQRQGPHLRRPQPQSRRGSFATVLIIPLREDATPVTHPTGMPPPFSGQPAPHQAGQTYATGRAGFYHLHVLPTHWVTDTHTCGSCDDLCDHLREGNWFEIAKDVRMLVQVTEPKLTDSQAGKAQLCLNLLSDAVKAIRLPHFDDDLALIDNRLQRLLSHLRSRGEKRHAARKQAILAVNALTEQRHTVAPVALEGSSSGDFAFAAAGDLQYHANMDAMKRFLAKLEHPNTWCENKPANPDLHGNGVPCDVARDLKFILLDGDVADSEAGSARVKLALNVLQILPPTSPYNGSGGNELVDVREAILRARRPIFAVPGNHDGYVGYGGVINTIVDEIASGFIDPAGRLVARMFGLRKFDPRAGRINHYVPTLIQWNLINRKPRYDGLGEWQTYLGPLNLAFSYRGHSFIGLNSYDLTAKERSAVGGTIFNWGGGLQDESVDWLAETLEYFASAGSDRQFVFAHHDPRAAVPTNPRYEERNFGIYDPTDTIASLLTFGFLGIGNSPRSGLRLPLITPAVSYGSRLLDASVNPVGEGQQQEWMRRMVWSWGKADESAYNARPLIQTISTFARPGRDSAKGGGASVPTQGFISHIFFAHNNVPIPAGGRVDGTPSKWADSSQDGFVFHEYQDHPWSGHEWIGVDPSSCWNPGNWLACQRPLTMWAVKYRNWEPPEWAREQTIHDGNAQVVRLDDLGDSTSKSYGYGFHVVHVHTDPTTGESRVDVYWVPL